MFDEARFSNINLGQIKMKEIVSKSDLVDLVAESKSNMPKAKVSELVNEIFNTIVQVMASGSKVSIAGFGVFDVKHKPERLGRNPQTGETIVIKASAVPQFKPGKNFKEQVATNNSVSLSLDEQGA
jgi:nucleoid DNA-binding protein